MEILDIVVNLPFFKGMKVAFSPLNPPLIGNLFLPSHVVVSLMSRGRWLDHGIAEIKVYPLIYTNIHAFNASMHSL